MGRTWMRYGLVGAAVLLAGGGVFLLVRSDDSGEPGTGTASPTSAQQTTVACPYEFIPEKEFGLEPLANPPAKRSRHNRLDAVVTARYTDPSKVSLGGCGLHMRSYNGNLFGPTLRLAQGDTMRLKLRNRLPVQTPAEIEDQYQQEASQAHIAHTPVPFNTTNMHFHGMHVSPRGHGDNVYLEIEPRKNYHYEIEVPAKHPPGTYWYHAHGHGSTAIQVASGMAGALIVEDDPKEIPAPLRAANEREKIMLFQTLLYDTSGELEQLNALFPGPADDPKCNKQAAPCHWQGSQRRTTVNGQIVPEIHMRPGEVQRWRMIDATFSESLFLELRGHALNEIALDGNYLGRVDSWSSDPIHLEPGYRSDVLVQAADLPSGVTRETYDLVDVGSSPKESLRGVAEDPQVLAKVVVSGEPMNMELPTDAQMAPLAPFPHLEDIADRATGVQTALFKLGFDAKQTDRLYFTVNYAPFSPNHVRTLFLNDIDEWRIGTVGDDDGFPTPTPSPTASPPPTIGPVKHVFHIHVNPFQVMREGPDGEPQMVWKDTLAVDGEPVSVYTKYTDFTGEFVIHCHILDHEDLGMMEAVKVVREDKLNPEPVHH